MTKWSTFQVLQDLQNNIKDWINTKTTTMLSPILQHENLVHKYNQHTKGRALDDWPAALRELEKQDPTYRN